MPKNNLPSPAEIQMAADVINRLPKDELTPLPLYNAMAGRLPLVTANLVVFKEVDDVAEVLLTQREQNDTYWPGQWHIPGKTFLASDETIDDPLQRVIEQELGDISVPKPVFVYEHYPLGVRGRELLKIFSAHAPKATEPPVGKFYPVFELPEPIIEGHEMMIFRTAVLRGVKSRRPGE